MKRLTLLPLIALLAALVFIPGDKALQSRLTAATVPEPTFLFPTGSTNPAADNESTASCSGKCLLNTATTPGAKVVVYAIYGGPVVAVATSETIYGWIAFWDSTTMASGNYVMVALSCVNVYDTSTCGHAVEPVTVTNPTVPATVPNNCSADATTGLTQYLSGLANGSFVALGPNACYLVSAPLTLRDKSNLTIVGNGATIKEQGPIPSFSPILNLWHDTNVSVTGLTLDGTNNGSNGGAGVEGDYGVVFEAVNGVTFTGDTIENTQGDWLFFSQPYDVNQETDALSTNVTFDGDTFLNAGYHGVTVESVGCLTLAPCNGLTIENSTMTNMGVDAMDFEVDVASTPFNPDGTPFWAAQDYVTIQNNVWSNWTNDWFASLQGQAPGVQFQHLTITGNTLNTTGPFMEVDGSYLGEPGTTAANLNSDWTITNNHYGPGHYAYSFHGGGSADSMIEDVNNLTMTGNGLADCPGNFEDPEPSSLCTGGLTHYAIQGFGLTGTIENNDFTGNLGVIQPESIADNVTATLCGNTVGPWGSSFLDAPC